MPTGLSPGLHELLGRLGDVAITLEAAGLHGANAVRAAATELARLARSNQALNDTNSTIATTDLPANDLDREPGPDPATLASWIVNSLGFEMRLWTADNGGGFALVDPDALTDCVQRAIETAPFMRMQVLAGMVAEAATMLGLIAGKNPERDGEVLQQAITILKLITGGARATTEAPASPAEASTMRSATQAPEPCERRA